MNLKTGRLNLASNVSAGGALTIYSTSNLTDKIQKCGSYPSFLGDNTAIYRTHIQFLTHNSKESGCYMSLLTDKHPSREVICVGITQTTSPAGVVDSRYELMTASLRSPFRIP